MQLSSIALRQRDWLDFTKGNKFFERKF